MQNDKTLQNGEQVKIPLTMQFALRAAMSALGINSEALQDQLAKGLQIVATLDERLTAIEAQLSRIEAHQKGNDHEQGH